LLSLLLLARCGRVAAMLVIRIGGFWTVFLNRGGHRLFVSTVEPAVCLNLAVSLSQSGCPLVSGSKITSKARTDR